VIAAEHSIGQCREYTPGRAGCKLAKPLLGLRDESSSPASRIRQRSTRIQDRGQFASSISGISLLAARLFEYSQSRAATRGACVREVVDERQGELAFLNVFADRFADNTLLARQVENVVLDLECDAHTPPKVRDKRGLIWRATARGGAKRA
jgi:hypothetical protein